MLWLVIAILVLGLLLGWQMLRRRYGIAIIRMQVGYTNYGDYQVVIQEMQPTKRSAEFVRILLGSAAGMLYWVDQKRDQRESMRQALLEELDGISQLELTPEFDLLGYCGDSVQVSEVAKLTVPRRFQATLYYQNLAYRFVKTRSLKSEDVQQLKAIWLSMASIAMAKWDQKLVDRFQGSLQALVAIYRADSDYLSTQSMIHYPNRAFLQYMTGTDANQ
jgi:hypothetical protein